MKIIFLLYLFLSPWLIEASSINVESLSFKYSNGAISVSLPIGSEPRIRASFVTEKKLKFIQLLNDEGGILLLPFPSKKLCKVNESEYETWSYHVNPDGTYGVVGVNVEIVGGEQLYIDQQSAVCGHTKLSGNVRIENSLVKGGVSSQENLTIRGDSGHESRQMLFKLADINSTGKILGNVVIENYEEKKIIGHVNIDACLYHDGLLVYDEQRTFLCDTTPHPNIPSDYTRITIINSSIDSPSFSFHRFGTIENSNLQGNLLIGEGPNWVSTTEIFFTNIAVSDVNYRAEVSGNIAVMNSVFKGKFRFSGNQTNDYTQYENVDADGENVINGIFNLGNVILRGKNDIAGAGSFAGSVDQKLYLEQNNFSGSMSFFRTSSINNTITNPRGDTGILINDVAFLGQFNKFSGKVAALPGTKIGNNVTLDGRTEPPESECSNCQKGIHLESGSEVDGVDTVVSGWIRLYNTKILNGSKILITFEGKDQFWESYGSTFTNGTYISGQLRAWDAYVSDVQISGGEIRCTQELGCYHWQASTSNSKKNDLFNSVLLY